MPTSHKPFFESEIWDKPDLFESEFVHYHTLKECFSLLKFVTSYGQHIPIASTS